MSFFTFGKSPSSNPNAVRSPKGRVVSRGHSKAQTTTAAAPAMANTGGGGGGSSGYQTDRYNVAFDRLEEGSVIEDWIPRDLPGINKMMRGIYTRDGVAGPAVDILSLLPWSPFDLTGIEDKTIRNFFEDAAKVFGENAEAMRDISTEYLVLGRFAASMIFNEGKGFWDDYIPHDSDFLTITPIPVQGYDPKLDLKLSPGMKQFISSQDYRDRVAMQALPDKLIKQLQSGQDIPLDPLSTLWCARSISPTDFVGTSIYTRILPYWALEKALLNATVTAARRRAGNILHVNVGLDEKWEPTEEEMSDIAGLFVQADEDPVGAVVVTRTGVEAQEIRDGGSLWKLSDEWQYLSEGKMRALGISEALLSGEACLTGESLVQTDQGLLRIDEISSGSFEDINLTVASRYGPEKASKWLYNGVRPTMDISTRTGHDVRCTHNHPLLVFDGESTCWKRADELGTGDLLCVNTRKLTRSDKLDLSLSEPEDVVHGGKRKTLSKPQEMGTDLAYFLGLLISEGGYTFNSRHVRFTNTDRAIIDRYVASIENVFGISSSVYHRDPTSGREIESRLPSWDVVTCSKTLTEWLHELGVSENTGRGSSYNKEVPWSILQADERSQLAFLAGFVEGDGGVDDRIAFFSSSTTLLKQIQVILTSHGFVTNRDGRSVTMTYYDSLLFWEVAGCFFSSKALSPKQRYKARNQFGFPLDSFTERLLNRRIKSTNSGIVFRNDEGEEVKIRGFKYPGWSDQKILYDKHDSGDYSTFLSQMESVSPSMASSLRELLERRYLLTEVTAIDDGGEYPVYDISMSTGVEPAFVADGLVVHNTYTNMEQARNTFVEQIRQFRMHMTNQVYMKMFRTLARAHGFVRKKQANLDHRVKISPESHQPQRPHGPGSGPQNLEDIELKQLSQEDALSLPDSDLVVPKIYWHKTLQPEADDVGLELMERLQERGFPVTMKMIASRAGQDLEEVMSDLDEDAKLREKINEWKSKWKGDDDSGGFGFANTTNKMNEIRPGKSPLWDRSKRFMGLHWNEAVGFVTDLAMDGSAYSQDEVLRRMNREFDGNTHKLQAMSYILQRLGIAKELPIDNKRVSEMANVISNNRDATRGDRHRELLTLAKITSNVVDDEKRRLEKQVEETAENVKMQSKDVSRRLSSEKGLPAKDVLSGVVQ